MLFATQVVVVNVAIYGNENNVSVPVVMLPSVLQGVHALKLLEHISP